MKYCQQILLLALFFITPAFADDQPKDINAVTLDGTKVVLHADGHWEYATGNVSDQKAPEAKPVAPVSSAVQETTNTANTATTTEAPASAKQGCPPGWQGGLFGLGRCVPPGDKDYNRGSLRTR